MQILSTHHLALTTGRFERLRSFYVELLGLPVVGGFPGQEIVFIQAGSTTIELIGESTAPDEVPGPALAAGAPALPTNDATAKARSTRFGWHHLAWEVEDVDSAFAELTERGVEVHSPPESFPGMAPTMRIAFLRDPDGNLLELVQPLGAPYPTTDMKAEAATA